jgi:hypothetical protein
MDQQMGSVGDRTPPNSIESPLPIVCLAIGELYGLGDDYPTRLYRMLERHCPRPFTLYCYSDRERRLPKAVVVRDCSGWTELDRPAMRPTTRKLGIFNPAYVEFDEFLYLDLTLVIRRSMDAFLDQALSRPEDLLIVGNWHYDGYNSSVMRVRSGALRVVYDAFVKGAEFAQRIPGDQDFIHGVIERERLQDRVGVFPVDQVVSFRKTLRAGRKDPDFARRRIAGATIVKFHGRPKMHEAFGVKYRVRTRLRELLRGQLTSVMPISALRREWLGA